LCGACAVNSGCYFIHDRRWKISSACLVFSPEHGNQPITKQSGPAAGDLSGGIAAIENDTIPTCRRNSFPIITSKCHVKTFQGDYQ
jgi:hypothetical protein